MKRYLLILFISMAFLSLTAQDSFSDDFENYNAGDYIGQVSSQWTTWSGSTGNAEDARVVDGIAASGTKSISLIGTSGGGPQDVVLPFGGKRTSGSFQFSMNMYIQNGNGAYFNFQGEVTIGSQWTMNARLNANGDLTIDDASSVRLSGIYPQDEWFNIAFDINLTSNLWQVLINGECIGSFANPNNFVASLDLFPLDETNVFFVDDVEYQYNPMAEDISFAVDVSLNSVVDGNFGITGSEKSLAVNITNEGSEMINSLELGITTNNGQTTETYNNLSLTPGDFQLIDIDATVILERGANAVTLEILKVNGMIADENMCNNIQNVVLEGFTPADNKKIMVEEATGTWCPWCPRGDVFMNLLAERYPERFVGIAVHNDDPMEVAAWDTGLTSTSGFTGFPSVVMNRESVMDPSTMEPAFVTRVQGVPLAYLTHGAEFDAFTRELTVDVTTHFNFQLQGDELRLFVGLTEDGVTGTTSDYNQANAYAGGGAGVMGGYELLPSSVPASQMVYNHVGRHLFTPYSGMQGAYVGEDIKSGTSVTHRFTYTIPDGYNHENMHIVSAFITPPPGVADNAESTTIEDATLNGLTSTIDIEIDNSIEVYPNPVNSLAHIEMSFDEPTEVRMVVTDLTGKLIASKEYGLVSGTQIFPFDGSSLESGIYFLKLFSGERFTTKRIVISH